MKLCVLILVGIVAPGLHCGCASARPTTEIDCSRFPQAVQHDESTPPEEYQVIDTDTAEKMILQKAYPKYPELAVRAGVEGTVRVKLWIGRDGSVKQASIARSDADIFNESSLEAARRLLFKTASCNGKAISVWATIPFRFEIAD